MLYFSYIYVKRKIPASPASAGLTGIFAVLFFIIVCRHTVFIPCILTFILQIIFLNRFNDRGDVLLIIFREKIFCNNSQQSDNQ